MSTLTVTEPPERAERPRAELPLESAGRTKGPQSFRVSKIVAGSPQFLGTIGSRATPETIIAQFPNTLPAPGMTCDYLLQGLTALNEQTGNPIPITITGDSPEVMRALAQIRTVAPSATSSAAESEVLKAAREMRAAAEKLLDEERAALRKREEALALQERAAHDKQVKAAEAQAAQQAQWWQGQLALADQRHQQQMDAERARREQDRKDADQRRADERAEQARADKIAEDARAEERRRWDQTRKDEAEARREHEKTLAALQATQSLETVVPKITAALGALGIKGSDIVGRLFGAPESAVSGAAAFAQPVADLLGKLTDQVGEVVKLNMELAARRDGVAVPQREREPKPRQIPANAERAPEKEKEKAERPELNAKLKDLDRPTIRDARVALRALAGELREEDPKDWEAKVVVAVAKQPAIIRYCKAMGVKEACMEAGLTETEATQVAAKAAAFGV